MDKQLRIAILISGRGSNMQKLVAAAADLPVQIVLVAADRQADVPSAGGINWARNAGLNCKTLLPSDYGGRCPGQERALAEAIEGAEADFIFLAGYMAILSAEFVGRFSNKIINIHPSLLPKYKGLHTHQRALQDDAREHGATVHLVTPALDDGPIILQGVVDVHTDDDADTLASRTLALEHRLYPLVLSALAHAELDIQGGKPIWKQTALDKLHKALPEIRPLIDLG